MREVDGLDFAVAALNLDVVGVGSRDGSSELVGSFFDVNWQGEQIVFHKTRFINILISIMIP